MSNAITPTDFKAAAMLWSRGFGTHDIARLLNLEEAIIYNRLDSIRAEAKGARVAA